jgi:hypothetical protein
LKAKNLPRLAVFVKTSRMQVLKEKPCWGEARHCQPKIFAFSWLALNMMSAVDRNRNLINAHSSIDSQDNHCFGLWGRVAMSKNEKAKFGFKYCELVMCAQLRFCTITAVKLRCDSRFQRAFTACSCVFKVITLIGSNQGNYFENATACSKRMRITLVATQLKFLTWSVAML